MHVYIVYAHPAKKSFSREVLNAFLQGLEEAGHTYQIGDLYQMNFQTDMDEDQYHREVGLDPYVAIPVDVKAEQLKINKSDALVFIFPVWWSDCPAKLKGWFDRVWTYGYAYFYDQDEQRKTQIHIKKALVICPAGHTIEHLEETGIAESMRRILLNDRLLGVGIGKAEIFILGGMMPGDDTFRDVNLSRAFDLGKNL
jgi:NAD(P)H dehydrogenase (quinone)